MPELKNIINEIMQIVDQRNLTRNDLVFVSGNFNILHPGHLRLLMFAKECGLILVVGVNHDDVPNITVRSEMRLAGINAISIVDYAFVLHDPVDKVLSELKPGVVVKGKEFSTFFNVEDEIVTSYGGKLLFGSGEIQFSSLDLLRKDYAEISPRAIEQPREYLARHNIKTSMILEVISRFRDLNVVVIGDLIVDRYIDCDAVGMSQEDPTLVVSPIKDEKFLGGSAIVAGHASRLGASVRYFSVVGADPLGDEASDLLSKFGVDAFLVSDKSRPTTLKTRYRSAGKTLLRVNSLRQHEITEDVANTIIERISEALVSADLLIFSDFNYGVLTDGLIAKIVEIAKNHGVLVAADSQSSSQTGDVSRFKKMDLITPTEHEARIALHDRGSGLAVLSEKLKSVSFSKHVVLTLGSEGALISAECEAEGSRTDRLPALVSSPKDTAGAGDSLLTCSAMALACGADIWSSVYIGVIAAACQVSRVGNIPLRTEDLVREVVDN